MTRHALHNAANQQRRKQKITEGHGDSRRLLNWPGYITGGIILSEEKIHNIVCDQCNKTVECGKHYAGVSPLKYWYRVTAPHNNAANFAERESFDFCSAACLSRFGTDKGWIVI
jgi:hypothetical protein